MGMAGGLGRYEPQRATYRVVFSLNELAEMITDIDKDLSVYRSPSEVCNMMHDIMELLLSRHESFIVSGCYDAIAARVIMCQYLSAHNTIAYNLVVAVYMQPIVDVLLGAIKWHVSSSLLNYDMYDYKIVLFYEVW